MSLDIDILTIEQTFCRVTSIDEEVKFFKVQMIHTKMIECFIEKKIFNSSLDIFDIQIFVNSSESFILSSNNQSFLFVKEELSWSHQRVFNPELKTLTLNYLIPFRNFAYNLELSGFNESLKCNFSSNSLVTCKTPLVYLKSIESLPSNLQYKFKITKFNLTTSISVQYLTYYEFTAIQHLKPFMISYYERLNHPLRIISNSIRSLNFASFQFLCNGNNYYFNLQVNQSTKYGGIQKNATFDVQEKEIEYGIKKNSHFICEFNSFGNELSSYNLSLSFVSIEGIILITKSDSQGIIRVKNEKVTISSSFGPKSGNYVIGPLKAFNFIFPTNLYSNYSFSLKLMDRGDSYDLGILNKQTNSFDLQMIDVSKYFSIWIKVVKQMQMDLFVNEMRMFTIDTKFSFYGLILSLIFRN
jgi:hypothetical protein